MSDEQREPICPYCGHEEQDTTDLTEDTETCCGRCGKDYAVEVIVDISYVTRKTT